MSPKLKMFKNGFLLLTSFSFLLYLLWMHKLYQIRDSNSFGIQKSHFGPRLEEQVRRILWWSTVFSRNPGSLALGSLGPDETFPSFAKKCKAKCEFTMDKNLLESSHALIFHGWVTDLPTQTVEIAGKNVTVPKNAPPKRYNSQIYIYLAMEPPSRISADMEAYRDFFNWTITYRLDSDFAVPYGFFKKKTEEEVQSYQPANDGIDYAKLARPNLVAWMVSNCDYAPSGRNGLVNELQKYIKIRIYGKCGDHQCCKSDTNCWDILAMLHKFYLSFENSLCQDYVTEKFFKAINANMVPVVYGIANYGLRFPPGSFINVDSFPSAKALAHYLLYLNENDEEYLKYFEWRKFYTVTKSWSMANALCGACERLHEHPQRPAILDINYWLFRNNSEYPVCENPPAES